MNDTPYLDKIIDEYVSEAKVFFPHLKFSRRSSFYSGDEPYSCNFEFALNSVILKDTEYHDKRNHRIIHYTPSVQTAIEILNSGFLRLSNLKSLNDPQEVSFITKRLNAKFNNEIIEDNKRTFFSASFCKVLSLQKPDAFPMWRMYGGDGYGAAIEFEIMNYGKEWFEYTLSKVQYGEKNASRLGKFLDFHEEFQKKYNNPLRNFPKTLSSILALHKNEIWNYEKEVRLLTYREFDKYTLKAENGFFTELKHSINRNGSKYSYLEFPLYNGKEYKRILAKLKEMKYPTFLDESFPKVKIKRLILGYNNSDSICFDVDDIVSNLSKEYGYKIPVIDSHLIKHMH